MVRNYQKKENQGKSEQILDVIRKIDNGELSLCAASKKFGIPKSTLSTKHKKFRNGESDKVRGRKPVFSIEVEERMTKVINVLAKWGYPLTKRMVLNVIQDFVVQLDLCTPFVDGKPGDDWFVNFCRRNNLKLKKCEQLQANRQQNTSDPFVIYDYYDSKDNELDETLAEPLQKVNISTILPKVTSFKKN
jgi:hypothetical protein